MPLQEFILELTKWAAAFSLLTLIVHLLQTRIIREWRAETDEILKTMARDQAKVNEAQAKAHEAQSEAHKAHEETMKAHEETMREIKETQRYIANLIVREGEKTRETIEDRL